MIIHCGKKYLNLVATYSHSIPGYNSFTTYIRTNLAVFTFLEQYKGVV